MNDKIRVPIWEKQNLTVEEAAEYSNIGQNKLRAMMGDPMCTFSLKVGSGKTLINRKKFDDFIAKKMEI
ncbi:MAG: hypothetical protein K6B14_05615 [Lachnospiraceae bacterium]|nr:hypothetical protein [Lachnospiraceae bacterium]